ncbi:Ankyrin repeat domain-containing protein [Pyrenophora tritici-repentis]|nr:Ankyrin repeat domain-containing protein [Pyrenophora tritici-repentis]KAI0605687.1 Ankyrin repeat domain-containing protein [Pyrenophora tritici-repentis]KAI1565181.1 Arp Ankyrin repeat [Pyrenophora tritici-repentis]PWO23501.1 K(+)H(+) antiporter 1 [Pyrenophora tritici-repentis]PZD26167.1 Arp, Ankyrin repeat protein [Pyrenophora tritici-repentis]
MEPAIRRIDLEMESDSAKAPALKRKGSTLQTSVEVLKCRFGKPAGTPEERGAFKPSKQWTPIYYAVYHQREAALSHFLRTGGSPDDITGTGQPPLCIAFASGYVETAKSLLEAGADVNATIKNTGETALHLAVKNGRNDLVELIIPYGANLDLKTYDTGETPLHYAASKSASLASAMTLIKHGASYDVLNVKGQTAAEAALKANNIQGAAAIINAARDKRDELVKEKEMLLKHVENTQGRFSIGNDLIADIFAAACDPESTVLVEAIKRNDAALVEMLLEKGSDPDQETTSGLRPIFVALDCASAPVVNALLKRGIDLKVLDKKQSTVLQAIFESPLAHEQETSALFAALLEQGADADVRYPDGKTLLHHAVSPIFDNTKYAQLLIDNGLDVDAQDEGGNTALHLATHSKSRVEMLLKNKANPHQTNVGGLTPLLYASTFCKKDKEPDLLSLVKVSDRSKTNANEQSALHLAAANGLEKTLRLLLRARPDIAVVDKDKNTPLLLAVKNHQWAVVPLLAIAPSINAWGTDGLIALHHIATSTPTEPETWADIAAATFPFCQRGDHQKREALYYAVTLGKPAFVEALLKNGATFNFEDWTSETAEMSPSVETNKQILKIFAQHEWQRRAALLRRLPTEADDGLFFFFTAFPIASLKQMISLGLDINALPKSPMGSSLLWAFLRHIPLQPPMSPDYLMEGLKTILAAGSDPNAEWVRSSRRSTPPQSPNSSRIGLPLTLRPLSFLLEECPGIDIAAVKLMLTQGADLSVASPFYAGRFPLHSAAKARRVNIVEELSLQRADMSCVDQSGRTPLFYAAEVGDWEITDTLLRRGAKVDIQDSTKDTPLHLAAVGGSKRVVAILLREEAKASMKNVQGLTPLERVPEDLEEQEKEKIEHRKKEQEKAEALLQEKHTEDHAATATETLQTPPQLKNRKSYSLFRKSSLFFSKSTGTNTPADNSAKMRKSSMLSLRITSTQEPNKPIPANHPSPNTPALLLASPDFFTTDFSTKMSQRSTAAVPTTLKRLPTPRVDSGLDSGQAGLVGREKDDKTALDLAAVNEKLANPRDSGHEFKDWLALTRMLDVDGV